MTILGETTLLAYVDGELDAATSEQVTRELAHDPKAAETVRLLRRSQALVREAFAAAEWQEVPPRLQALVEPGRGAVWRLGRRRFSAGLAASLAACAVGIAGGAALERTVLQPERPGARLLDEVAEYHASLAGEASRLAIAPARDAAEIRSWFSAVLARPVSIPDLAPFGLAFDGARLLIVDSRPVTQLLYATKGNPGHPLGVCITAWHGPARRLEIARRDGLSLALWAHGRYAYVVVGWLPAARLEKITAWIKPVLETA